MESDSVPHISDMDSPGSSVSSSLQREYEELLKYAVVTPKIQLASSVYGQSIPLKDTAASETSASGSATSSNTSTYHKSHLLSKILTKFVEIVDLLEYNWIKRLFKSPNGISLR